MKMNIYEKELINEFFKNIREFKKNVLEKTNNLYKISFIKYEKDKNNNNVNTKRFTLKEPFYPNKLDNVIFNNKIYYKNKYKYENIYISLDNTNEKTNLLWLDDIKLENFTEEQLQYFTLIETSPNNYQGFVILYEEVDKNTLKKIKLYFCNKYKTDRGSIDFSHLMRLPFFYSYKHNEPFYINVKQYQKKILPVKPLLNKVNNYFKNNKKTKNNKYINKKFSINENNYLIYDEDKLKTIYNEYLKEKEKIYKENIDYNVIDYRFIHYLYNLNYNIDKIHWKFVLYNLEKRKKGHINDYITRTINKIKEDTEYENPDINLLRKLFKKTIENNDFYKKLKFVFEKLL